jgi:hypothetical protein
MTAFIELCDPRRDSLAVSASDISWGSISDLSKLHGVTSFFYYRARTLGVKLPEQIEKEWLGIYLHQIAEEKKARQQINEIKEVLDSEKILVILLKGASAVLRLYPKPGLRTFVDLDILIPSDRISQFKQTMMKIGYKSLSARNSPEDEELQKFDGHLDPLLKEEGTMIEPHLSILGAGGDHLINLPEIWQEKEETNSDGIKVCHLSREQFIVHTMYHFSRHLSDEGFAEIKWLVDILYAIKAWNIHWSRVWDITLRWGVEKDVLPILATLNHYWHTDIPVTEKAIPIDLQTLVVGVKDWQKKYYSNLPASYLERLLKLRELPSKTSQVRYLFHLLFPTPKNLRWRYGLSQGVSLAPYYILHPILTFKKFVIGVWHQIIFKTQ